MIAIFVLLSPLVESMILWTLILALQVISTIAHIARIYALKIHHLMVMIREIQMLFTVTYILGMHFVNQHTEKLK